MDGCHHLMEAQVIFGLNRLQTSYHLQEYSWQSQTAPTFGLELQLLLPAPGVMIVLSQLLSHRLHGEVCINHQATDTCLTNYEIIGTVPNAYL